MALLELEGVDAFYGRVQALHSVTLELDKGEIVALIGSNGAGKTTTLRTISGLMHPAKGKVTFDGADITFLEPAKVVAMGICHSPEGRRLFPRMSVLDNLYMGAYTRADKAGIDKDLKHVFELFPRVEERRSQIAGTLSGGEQQMLAMGRALMGAPKLLMLDEPSLGLAPIIVADIFRTIGELRAAGVSVLLVEQNAKAALQIADRAYVMELGEFILSGAAKDIAANQRVAASYLGFQHEGASRV
jgi:branched-chain amino acid transport system ATP-binding protein